MLGLTLGGVSSSSPVAVSVPSQPGEIPSKGGADKGWGPAASGEGKCVGAAPLSRVSRAPGSRWSQLDLQLCSPG